MSWAGAGVRVDHLFSDPDAATGTAQIVVDGKGQNAIVVASGANERVVVTDVSSAAALWDEASLVVLQLEISLTTIAAAVGIAAARGLPIVLNAAPAQSLPDELLRPVTWLVINEVEAEQLSGRTVRTSSDARHAAAALRRSGQHVVVTLGAAGAVCVSDEATTQVPAPRVNVVDTTAAGDAFVGALAAALHRHAAPATALREAVVAGSLACTKLGAIPSLPTAAEVAEAVGRSQGAVGGKSRR